MQFIEIDSQEQRDVKSYLRGRLKRTKQLLQELTKPYDNDKVITVKTMDEFLQRIYFAKELAGVPYTDKTIDAYIINLLVRFFKVSDKQKDELGDFQFGIFGHSLDDQMDLDPESAPPEIQFTVEKGRADYFLFVHGYNGPSRFQQYDMRRDDRLDIARVSLVRAAALKPRIRERTLRADAEMCTRIERNFEATVEVMRALRINYNDELEKLIKQTNT